MNAGTTFGAALLRGLYTFIAVFLMTGINAYLGLGVVIDRNLEGVGVSERDRIVYAVLTGIVAGLGGLGWRVGAEGVYDASRDAKGDVAASDVGQVSTVVPPPVQPTPVV